MAKFAINDEVYLVDKDTKQADRRFKGYVSQVGSECPLHTKTDIAEVKCETVLINWYAGNSGWTHTIYLIPANIVVEDPETGLPVQTRCNCECEACSDIHLVGDCSTRVYAHYPTMTYLGKVCIQCARRITENGGGSYLTWPNPPETDNRPKVDEVGEALESDDPLMKLKARLQDTALEVYNKARSVPRRPNWEVLPIVGNLPFVVIGNFAYVLGHDGALYAAPYVQDLKAKSGMSVDWHTMVKVSEVTVIQGFPTDRLKHLIMDIQNMTDVMRQHGVQVETDKVVRPTILD